MTATYPNVEVYELYNEFRTASTPRNECLDHIRSKYVFFLDSDDFLYPDALEKLRTAMEENNAEIGSFREESIEGTAGLVGVEHLRFKFLLDQTKPLIVLNRNDPEMEQYLDPHNMTVHKMYRLSLLTDNNIRFLDRTTMGEDVVFNLNCAKFYKTIVVLPQYIGYGYFLNAGSLAQSNMVVSPEKMDTFLSDRLDWIKMAVQTGLNTANTGWAGLAIAAQILSAPGIPDEYRQSWKERYLPYADMFPPLKPSKLYNPALVQQLTGLVRMCFAKTGDSPKVRGNIGFL